MIRGDERKLKQVLLDPLVQCPEVHATRRDGSTSAPVCGTNTPTTMYRAMDVQFWTDKVEQEMQKFT